MSGLAVLSGLPGVGKSSVARVLAERTGALWLRVDAIEQEMRHSHMQVADLADGGYAAMRVVAKQALAQGYRVVADSVNSVAVTRDPMAAVAREAGAALAEVELICSNRSEHRRRVETRESDIPGLALPDWEAVVAREYEAWTRDVLRLDTSTMTAEDAAECIKEAMGWRS